MNQVGLIYTSTDSGVTWTPRESNRHWYSVASSADGSMLVAVEFNGQIYTSTDSGVTWTPRESNRAWTAVASSADGSKLVATVDLGLIYNSVCTPTPLVSLNCATNKTIECGTSWSFDPPTVVDPCCPNVQPTILSTVTNGACPQVITRTWQAIDCCNNTNTCSQTVTVVDTTPPTISCAADIIHGFLDTNCQLHIPLIRREATDNCTPASQLVYTQNPVAGTVVPGPSHPVTMTVTDLCGNSSQCHFTVVGRIPSLVVHGPGAVTVTNCSVPNVANLVTVTGCCSPFRFTQSPVTGATIGPGLNSITVTVSDACGNKSTCVIAMQFSGPMSFLNQLYNTGMNPNGAGLLADGGHDIHYALVLGVPANTMPLDYNANSTPVAVPPYPLGTPQGWWSSFGSTASKWIGPDYDENYFCPAGTYTYSETFTLPPGALPSRVSISGQWAADNGAGMYLNVISPSTLVTSLPVPMGFAGFPTFTINGGFLANPMVNTIYFVVTNLNLSDEISGSPTGLRVEFTNAVVNCSTCSPPAIVWATGNQALQVLPFANNVATFTVDVLGTLPISYLWYHNDVPIPGATASTLAVGVHSLAAGGNYMVIASNPCGSATNVALLTVTEPGLPPVPTGLWDFTTVGNPFAATIGPDLILSGSNTLAIVSGTTLDFGLPNPAGPILSVISVPALPADTTIQLPLIAPPGSNSVSSYTLIMDVYSLSSSSGTIRTLFGPSPTNIILMNSLT